MRAIRNCLNSWIAIVLIAVEKKGQILEVDKDIMENNKEALHYRSC